MTSRWRFPSHLARRCFGERALASLLAGWLLLFGFSTAQVVADDAAVQLPPRESFHLYLLIGQSNMAGRGKVEAQDQMPHPRVFMFTADRQWKPAVDPLHFDKPTIAGVGLGSSFGRAMAEANPDVAIGLIPCAVGGTPLAQWEKKGNLYAQAVERTKAALAAGTLRGILWHQGESDAGRQATAENYAERLSRMIADLRGELGAEDAPFVAGELGRFLAVERNGQPSYWRTVNEQLHLIPQRVPRTAVVSSEELQHKGDVVHFDSPSLREFGRRYAAAMQQLQKASTPSQKQP